MISVVIPLYNKEKQIAATLRSVFNQTFQDFEVVIVNDGSTDSSVSVVESLGDSRIRLINQKNSGVSAARNRGIDEAKGELIAFLDADDEWKQEYLETQMSLVRKYPQCDVFATNYEFRDETGKVTSTIIRKLPFQGETGILTNYFEVASCSHPPICSISIMVRRVAIKLVGGFPIGVNSGEDLLTWARLACRYKIAYSQHVFAVYNLGEGYDFRNLPPRRQDDDDPVGKVLVGLWKQLPRTKGLRKYIGHWHKMRSSVALRYGERWETIKEALLCLKYNPISYKVCPFIALALLPEGMRNYLIRKAKT